MLYLTLYALFMLDHDRPLDVSRYQVGPGVQALQVAQVEERPISVYRHGGGNPDCTVNDEGKGRRLFDCARQDSQTRYRLLVYPDYRHGLPVGKTRSRLPREPVHGDIRIVGPTFLQDPEDTLDLRFPGR